MMSLKIENLKEFINFKGKAKFLDYLYYNILYFLKKILFFFFLSCILLILLNIKRNISAGIYCYRRSQLLI